MSEEKRQLRTKMKELTASFGDYYIKSTDAIISEQILSWDIYTKAKSIFIYGQMNKEIDTTQIIENALSTNKTVCLPKCYSNGLMEAYQIKNLSDIVLGYKGTPEPSNTETIIPKEQLDLIIVPCLAADCSGYRLGYGGGFYDRYLKDYNGISIVLCRKKQMVKKIPTETFDVPVGYYVTEEGIVTSLFS